MVMGRIMALDVGDKRIGVALSDELGMMAMPGTVIERSQSEKADLRAVVQLVQENDVSKVVIGIPIMLDGTSGVQADKVRAFMEKLVRRLRVPVEEWDERMTTLEAEKLLIAADRSRSERREVIDKLAATLILQSYLEAHRERG
jgi:putative holliday junction resolvase